MQLLCYKGEKWPSANQGISITNQDSHHVHSTPCLNLATYLCPTLLQNLSSKLIALIASMRPELDDEYTYHQWLMDYTR